MPAVVGGRGVGQGPACSALPLHWVCAALPARIPAGKLALPGSLLMAVAGERLVLGVAETCLAIPAQPPLCPLTSLRCVWLKTWEMLRQTAWLPPRGASLVWGLEQKGRLGWGWRSVGAQRVASTRTVRHGAPLAQRSLS